VRVLISVEKTRGVSDVVTSLAGPFTVRQLALFIAWVAVAATFVRYREAIWLGMDVANHGYGTVYFMSGWFCVGVALVVFRAKTRPGRFLGLAMLLLSMLIVPRFFPSHLLAHEPDYPFYYQVVLLGSSAGLIVAANVAAVLGFVLRRAERRKMSAASIGTDPGQSATVGAGRS
jgi:hypothetical protein